MVEKILNLLGFTRSDLRNGINEGLRSGRDLGQLQLVVCDSLLDIRLYPEVLANKIINYSG